MQRLMVLGSFDAQPSSFSPAFATSSHDSSRLSPLSNISQPVHAETAYHERSDTLRRFKQEHVSIADSPFESSTSHQFLGLAGHNPLFSRDRDLSSHVMTQTCPSPLGFLPINRNRERAHFQSNNGHTIPDEKAVKIESIASANGVCLDGGGSFLDRPVWDDVQSQHDDSQGGHNLNE